MRKQGIMRDGAELVSEEFFPLFRSVVTSLIRERGGVAVAECSATTKTEDTSVSTRRLSGRQRLVITR